MQLYLLRHAQSESNARWDRNPGETFHYPDPDLTNLGHTQAEAVAAALAKRNEEIIEKKHDPWNHRGFDITHIYTSLMIRAVETANHIGKQLDLPVQGRTDLHEWGGIYKLNDETGENTGIPGNNRAFFEANYPRIVLPDDFNDDGWWDRPYETPEDVPARADRVVDWLISIHAATSDRVLVVSHGGFLNHLIGRLLNLTAEQTQRNLDQRIWLVLNNTGMTRVDILPDSRWLVYHNRIDHLSPEKIT